MQRHQAPTDITAFGSKIPNHLSYIQSFMPAAPPALSYLVSCADIQGRKTTCNTCLVALAQLLTDSITHSFTFPLPHLGLCVCRRVAPGPRPVLEADQVLSVPQLTCQQADLQGVHGAQSCV
jgi:hypothetical protein